MSWRRKVEREILKAYVISKVDTKVKIVSSTLFILYLIVGFSFAQTNSDSGSASLDDSFGSLLNLITGWITGNLGKTIAFVGMAISAIIFLFSRSWAVLFYGIIGSLLLGGIVGITKGSFSTGASTFGNSW